jgi:hypothetical protein
MSVRTLATFAEILVVLLSISRHAEQYLDHDTAASLCIFSYSSFSIIQSLNAVYSDITAAL